MIQVESGETQDYAREAKSTEHEEMEEDFRTERCKRSAKAFVSLWQSSVVVNEGDEAYTTNLCQKCFKKMERAEKVLRTACVNSFKVDNERALDVRSFSRGTRTFSSTKAESARRVPGGDC